MNNFVFLAEKDDMSYPSALPSVMVPAMSYMPMQFYTEALEPDKAFLCGSAFPELIKPFLGCEAE